MPYGSTLRAILGAGGGVNAVNFNGTNAYLDYGSDLTGVSDGKIWLFSVWVKPASFSGPLFGGNPEPSFSFGGDGGASIALYTPSSSSNPLIASLPASTFTLGTWSHVLFVVDLTDTAKRFCYVDDSAVTVTWTAYVDETCEFSAPADIGARSGGSKYSGDMAEFYMDFGNYLDISVEANRRKFITAAGKPADLSGDGSAPTGTAPALFFSGATSAWHTNKGTGGGFTENGTLTTATSSPSD